MRALKRVFSGTSAAVLTLSSLMSFGITGVAHAAGPDFNCLWNPTGTGDHVSFSDPGNWTGCGTGANAYPGTDNTKTYDLTFDATGLSANKTLNDDINTQSNTTLKVVYLHFTGNNTQFNYTIGSTSSKTITLNGGIDVADSSPIITADLLLSFGASFTSTGNADDVTIGNLNLNGHDLSVGDGTNTFATLLTGSLSGAGNVSVLNKGNLEISASPSTSWVGSLSVADGGIAVTTGAHALGADANSVTVASGGSLAFAGMNGGSVPQTITVGGSGVDSTDAASAFSFDDAITGDVVLTGTVNLTSNTLVDGDSKITVSGPLHGNYTISPSVGTEATLVVNSSDNQSQTKNGTYEAPVTTQTVAAGDNQPNTFVEVGKNVTEVIDGQRGDTVVANLGVLQGTGQVSYLTAIKGSIVAPGHSPGKLTVVNALNLGGGATYQAQLKDTAAGDFDQLVVGQATDTTGNDVNLGDGTPADGLPTLDTSLYDGYKIKAGDQFEVINNLSKTAVKGTFNNLPEGATFSVSGATFKISYVGGDGNDVVLTVVTAPKTPDTGFTLVSSHPGATLGLTVLAAGTILAIARNNRKLAPAKARATSKRL